ncbi:MBL fold metallo-hydrolase [Pelagicoccus sp. SDUM812003]|uniref:MBL fold metallo-hydrolase n=1 Tax=Pelagicoccus sp. SDUM812003 TaxID=3041267 RepID=UPI00280E4B96|nr:MBL fold metallo-hydrolase [Pelagicoccus sp. SDUM812003]MDQ8205041.1 MBL fold metallo-hydrolase [Pelagicoccus sp. SDUM812003]
MALIVEPIYAEGIAQLSYLVGDDTEGVAAVIDPRPDCDAYLRVAKDRGLKIAAIYETHIHADFMSGSLALQQRLGGKTPIRVSSEGDADYDFKHEKVSDGSEDRFGELRLVARHTPGHTPEHLTYLAYHGSNDTAFALFSGDTLFVNSVGRPDLLGDDETQKLAGQLFESIHGFYADLDDGIMVYPGHGAGSACGPDIGDRMFSTVGYERKNNPYFAVADKDAFIEKTLKAAPEEPSHYRPLKMLNRSVKNSRTYTNTPQAMDASTLENWIREKEATVLDTRSSISFSSAHIPDSLNIEAKGELSVWSGWTLNFDEPLILVLEKDSDLEKVRALLWRTGHHNVVGYLVGGIMNWIMEGKPISSIKTYSVEQLHRERDALQVLDVRSASERENGFIPGSKHLFLPEIAENALDRLDPNRPVVTYCASGFRASIAASVLKRVGVTRVGTLPGSWIAWKQADMPIETDEEELQPA